MITTVDVYVCTVLTEFWYSSEMGYSAKGSDFVVLRLLFLRSALRLQRYNVRPRARGALARPQECSGAHYSVLPAV